MSSKDLTEALHKLTLAARGETEGPPAMKARGSAPAVKSAALLGSGAGGSGSIASPLVETAYAARTFHTTVNVPSTDGLFTLKIKPVKEIFFLDANGLAVTMEYKAPV